MADKASATKAALAVPERAERRDILGEIDRIYDSIARRAFAMFEDGGRIHGRDLADWFGAESELLHPVRVNLTETDDALTAQAEVPGFAPNDLEIKIEPRRLMITGKRESSEEQKKGKAVYQEHRANEILRVVELPVDVDAEKSTATLKNGMLQLRMPKSAKSKGTRIEVKPA